MRRKGFIAPRPLPCLAGAEKPPGAAWQKGSTVAGRKSYREENIFILHLLSFFIRRTSFGRKRFLRSKREKNKEKGKKKLVLVVVRKRVKIETCDSLG